MPNGGLRGGYGIRPGEYTRPSAETEVKIPTQTYVRIGLVGTISIVCAYIVAWMLRLYIYLDTDGTFAQWVKHDWYPLFRVRWPIAIALIALWWGIAATLPTIYRFTIEQITKHLPPVSQPWDPKDGMWTPFANWRRRRIERAGLEQTYRERFGK